MESPKVTHEPIELARPLVCVPRRLLPFSFAVAVLAPYLARLPGVVIHGPEWLFSYMSDSIAIVLMSAIPAGALYLVGKISDKTPLAFWGAVAASTGCALWAYGSMNLAASSTAAIGLMFIPIVCAFSVIPGAVMGWIVHRAIKSEAARRVIAWAGCVGAIVFGLNSTVHDQAEVAQRESKFPVVSVSELPFTKRMVVGCCEMTGVQALALDDFDSEPGQEVAVLLVNDISVLMSADTYAVKSKTQMRKPECDGCLGMYPQIAADGKESFVVASSDGVFDRAGRDLWRLDGAAFSKLVPLRLPDGGGLTFFSTSEETPSRLERHDDQGTVLWTFKDPVLDVGIVENVDGIRLPAATIAKDTLAEWWVFSLDGEPIQKITLPQWALTASSIAWPSRGHLLAGGLSWIRVLDPEGKQVFLHEIQGTSFRPYHGPDGVAVRFNPTQKPYLAVMSHGSSGYPRSVLLIFDPNGRLKWQEEMNSLSAILAVPQADGKGDVLLVGGRNGVTEYRLADASAPNRQLDKDGEPPR